MTSTLPIAAFFGVFAAELRSVQRLAANAPVAVAIQASGVPDQRFGYLDSTVDAMAETLFGSPMVLPGASRRWSRTQPPAARGGRHRGQGAGKRGLGADRCVRHATRH